MQPRVSTRLLALAVASFAALLQLALTTAVSAAVSERSVYYSYDYMGRQLTAKFDSANGADGVTNSYNGFGELTSSTTAMGTFSKTLRSSYDAAGRRTQLVHPENSSGYTFSYCHDALSRLTSIREGPSCTSTVLDSFAYGTNGLVSNRTENAPLGSSAAYSWDDAGRLVAQTDGFYGADSDVTWTLAYNPASQIVSESRSNDSYAWTGAVDVNRDYAVNGLNQYTSAGPATFAYDANGNLTSDGSNTYTYDVENRLVKATSVGAFVGNVGQVNLTYDPLGRLYQVDQGTIGTIRRFVYDGDAMVLEYDGGGSVTNRYVHGSNAAADDPLVWYAGATLGTKRFLHADHLGSIVAIGDQNGLEYAINSYDEYGINAAANNTDERFGYTGQAYIPELGLYYYKARFYSPTLGRFLQTDPIGYKDQINLYAYVGNDPVDHLDPTGTQEAILFADADVSRSATYSSDDPNAGVKAVAAMNAGAVSGAIALGGVPASIADAGLAGTAQTVAVSGTAGALANGAIAGAQGEKILPAAATGAFTSVFTALSPGGAKGRFAKAAAVGNAAAVAQKVIGGSNGEALIAGVVAVASNYCPATKKELRLRGRERLRFSDRWAALQPKREPVRL